MSDSSTPTRAALVTPKGRGAVACISVAGPRALVAVESQFQSASGRRLADQPLDRIAFGAWRATGEEVVVVRRNEASVEVHCHGGAAAAEAVLKSLADAGCIPIGWQELIAIEESSPIRAAARIAMASCSTQRTAIILLDQYQGALDRAIERIVVQLDAGELAKAISTMGGLVAWGALGRHLISPWRVVIAGPPNVGKSTLINALVGYERAIVFDQPGTTRDVVTAGAAIDGWPIELADTAGLRSGGDNLEQMGAARARAALKSADLTILVFDATQPWSAENDDLVSGHQAALIVYNKCDLLTAKETLTAALPNKPAGLLASAKTGQNLAALHDCIARRLVPRAPPAGAAVPFTAEQAADIGTALAHAQAGQAAKAAAVLAHLAAILRAQ